MVLGNCWTCSKPLASSIAMAPSKLAFFLAVNMALLAATAHGCGSYCPSPVPVPTPPIAVPPPAPVTPTPVPPTGCGSYCPPSPVPVRTPPIAVPPPAPVTPTPLPPAGCGSYCPSPVPVPQTGGSGVCSINTLKLSECANVLNLLKLNLGVLSTNKCCPLLSGLADLDAAVCLCTAIKANVLGINLNVPVDLVLLLNQCGKTCPADFSCPI
ncbi:unnamed protein product [Alopecurus aequalis]